MPTVRDVLEAIEAAAPARFAYSFDRIGLQVGDPGTPVATVVFSLDPSLAAVRFALAKNAQMLVCHHPVIWDPLPNLRYDGYRASILREMIEGGIAFAAAHTNWDCAPGGVNDVLTDLIGLRDVRAFGSASDKEATKIAVTVPRGAEEAVVDAMSSAGAGVIGLYERCAFSSPGTGSFRALDGARPSVGSVGGVERVEESRIEMVCPGESVDAVLAALLAAHPYEVPAYDVYPVKPFGGQRIGRIGSLPGALSLDRFHAMLDERLSARTLLCGPQGAQVQTVAVCGGAAADEWQNAKAAGADAFVTGEVPHHLMVEASECGMAIAACGHFATESPGALRLARAVSERAGVQVLEFAPEAGSSGRPL